MKGSGVASRIPSAELSIRFLDLSIPNYYFSELLSIVLHLCATELRNPHPSPLFEFPTMPGSILPPVLCPSRPVDRRPTKCHFSAGQEEKEGEGGKEGGTTDRCKNRMICGFAISAATPPPPLLQQEEKIKCFNLSFQLDFNPNLEVSTKSFVFHSAPMRPCLN